MSVSLVTQLLETLENFGTCLQDKESYQEKGDDSGNMSWVHQQQEQLQGLGVTLWSQIVAYLANHTKGWEQDCAKYTEEAEVDEGKNSELIHIWLLLRQGMDKVARNGLQSTDKVKSTTATTIASHLEDSAGGQDICDTVVEASRRTLLVCEKEFELSQNSSPSGDEDEGRGALQKLQHITKSSLEQDLKQLNELFVEAVAFPYARIVASSCEDGCCWDYRDQAVALKIWELAIRRRWAVILSPGEESKFRQSWLHAIARIHASYELESATYDTVVPAKAVKHELAAWTSLPRAWALARQTYVEKFRELRKVLLPPVASVVLAIVECNAWGALTSPFSIIPGLNCLGHFKVQFYLYITRSCLLHPWATSHYQDPMAEVAMVTACKIFQCLHNHAAQSKEDVDKVLGGYFRHGRWIQSWLHVRRRYFDAGMQEFIHETFLEIVLPDGESPLPRHLCSPHLTDEQGGMCAFSIARKYAATFPNKIPPHCPKFARRLERLLNGSPCTALKA